MWDQGLPGFGVYKNSKGTAVFVYRYRAGAAFRQKKIGARTYMTCKQAHAKALELAYKRSCGIDPILEERKVVEEERAAERLLVRNYAEDWIARKERSKSPFDKGVQSTIRKQVVGKLGDRRLDQINLEEVEAAGREIQDATGASGRWFYTYVKSMFTDAEKRNVIVKSPLMALEVPQPNERDRVLSTDELRIFLMAAYDMLDARGDQFEMLVRVPKRVSEVSNLPWSEIVRTADTWVWELPWYRSKNKVAQTIILPMQVRALLERQMPDPSARTGLVFARGAEKRKEIRSSARMILDAGMHRRLELAEKEGIKMPPINHFTIHDLRTAVSTALQRKPFSVQPHVIEAMLNHKPPSKVQRTYQQDKYVPEVGEALVAWNDLVDRLLGDPREWIGGATLPKMPGKEVRRRRLEFRADWTEEDDEED